MKIILYGTASDTTELGERIAALPGFCYRDVRVVAFSDYDGLVAGLDASPPDLVIIAMDGADGMEGVIAVRSAVGNIPVVWFSNDKGFGVQSYRLGCAYFHEKPVSHEVLTSAISKCV